jgi:hypothetical protein
VPNGLLDLVGDLEDGSTEEAARSGIEDINTPELDGDLPMTSSGIIDIEVVSRLSQLKAFQHISLWKDDKLAINVLTGNNILNEETLPSYFTSAFPIILPWGTGKHIKNPRSQNTKIKIKKDRSEKVGVITSKTFFQVITYPNQIY